MKISARNALKGKIAKITKGATTSHVLIDVNGATGGMIMCQTVPEMTPKDTRSR